MSALKRSGHARLKAALLLRDALAAELGISLAAAMGQLRAVENNIGAARALSDGHYLAGLASITQGDAAQLSALDAALRQACGRVRFAPRYAQYLALLLFAHWAEAQLDDAAAFLLRLNAWQAAHQAKDEAVSAQLPPFVEADLQLAAFWMATAAGKTHVLHACLALLDKRRDWDRLIVITPSESLTRQHAEKLRELAAWPVFAYPQDGDAAALGRLPPDAVIVLDINKLATEKKGDGVTVPTSVFADGRNLVFVDEGHKGQKSEAGVWKKLQADLAGINADLPAQRGLLIEFSATFGQIVEAEHAFDRYAKAVIFDYAYDRFHRDRYGKDFWHVRVQAKDEASAAAQQQTLTAALLAFWHQVACFRSPAAQQAAAALGVQVFSPLWVLLGLSVIGSTKNENDKQQTSDVVSVLAYLSSMLAQPGRLAERIGQVLDATTVGADLLPGTVRQATAGWDRNALAERVLADCFGWQAGDKPVLRLIKAASGELGLGLLRGDTSHYYGVVNVGDAAGLRKSLESAQWPVEDDALSGSLFAALDTPGSRLNVLIGSRRFAEGWDNFRASSLTLLRLGQGEGSLIIQMFGRVVRFAGVGGDGKRLEKPPAELAPLQTAYVFGLKSGYLDIFLQSLTDNGVLDVQRVECPVRRHAPPGLLSVRAMTPPASEFRVSATGEAWLAGVNPIKISLTASIATSRLQNGQVAVRQGVVGENISDQFKQRATLLDLDAVYREMVDWKRAQRWWNFAFDRAAIVGALNSAKYEIIGLPEMLIVRDADDLSRLNRLACTVVRRLFEAAYRKEESRNSRYRLIPAHESYFPEQYYKEFLHAP
jgi:Type III restriction enzyme, res subunit